MLEQRIVIRLQRAGSGDNGRKAGSFGHRDTADIQVMHQGAQARERRIALEAKARKQYLESHLGVDVRECRAIEIKAERPFRLVLDAFEPDKFGLSVDKAPN